MFIIDTRQMRNGKPVVFSTWVLERIYCEKDGEIVEECGSSIPYLFVVDFDNNTDGYKVVEYFL